MNQFQKKRSPFPPQLYRMIQILLDFLYKSFSSICVIGFVGTILIDDEFYWFLKHPIVKDLLLCFLLPFTLPLVFIKDFLNKARMLTLEDFKFELLKRWQNFVSLGGSSAAADNGFVSQNYHGVAEQPSLKKSPNKLIPQPHLYRSSGTTKRSAKNSLFDYQQL
jgi:hypothetical protein